MIRHKCKHCNVLLENRDTEAGTRDVCPVCGTAFDVPVVIRFECPRCHNQLYSPEELGGRSDTCPLCRARFRVPLSSRQKERQRREQAEQARRRAVDRAQREAKKRTTRGAEAVARRQAASHASIQPAQVRAVQGGALRAPAPMQQKLLPIPSWAWSMADDMKRDLDRLSELGVTLDKAAAIAKPVGVGAGLVVGFRIHPLLGIAVAGAGLLAKLATDGWKRVEIEEVRQKWLRKLTDMNEDQLAAFAGAVQSRYPLLVPATGLLLPSDA